MGKKDDSPPPNVTKNVGDALLLTAHGWAWCPQTKVLHPLIRGDLALCHGPAGARSDTSDCNRGLSLF